MKERMPDDPMKKQTKITVSVIAAVCIVAIAAICVITAMNKGGNTTVENSTHMVVIEMEDGATMKLELYPEYAPKTVANFEKLVKEGFYDGLTFHRVISGFMIQGGDPEGTGMGGSDETIPGEFSSNGFKQNTLSHTRGVISMARTTVPDSATSQFFIVHEDSTFLDGQYAAFGKVVEGIEEVDKIASVATDSSDKPLTPVVIKGITMAE